MPSWSRAGQQPRDPADTRTGHRQQEARRETIRFTAADFAGLRDRTVRRPIVFVRVDVGPDGRAIACSLQESSGNERVDERICRLIRRRTLQVPIDVFGDAAGGRQSLPVDLRAIGEAR
jgi:hypothetical protein